MYIHEVIKDSLKNSKTFLWFFVYKMQGFQPNSMPILGYMTINSRDNILQSEYKNIKYF